MQLTQPWALVLLALVPLLWLARPQPPRRRVLVAAPHLWVARTTRLPTPSPWSWRQTPLGWVQAALAAALTVAVAGPRVSATSDSIAIVLDASLSMQARAGATSRWEEAIAEIQRLVREQPRGAPVLLWVAGHSPRLLGSIEGGAEGGAGLLAVAAAAPTDGRANLEAAIDAATQHPSRPSRTFVVSDGVAPTASSPIDWRPIGRPVDNVAITSLVVERQRENGQLRATIVVRNYGASAVSPSLALAANDATPIRRTLAVAPRSSASLSVAVDGARPDRFVQSAVTATLDVADGLKADNTRYAVERSPSPIRVAFSGRSPFARAAVDALPGAIVVDRSEPHDVIVCASCDQAPDSRTPSLLTAPPGTSGAASAPIVVRVDHPLLEGVPVGDVDVAPRVAPLRPGDIAAARAGSVPAIVVRETGDRPIVELRFDVEDPRVALTPFFPLLVGNAITWLSDWRRAPRELLAGEPFVWRAGDLGELESTRAHAGSREIEVVRRGDSVTVADTETAGVYEIAAGSRGHRFVVNPDTSEESNLSTAPSARAATAGAPAPLPSRTPASMDLTPVLLALALVVLALEWRMRSRTTAAGRSWWSTASRLAVAGLTLAALAALRLPWGTAPLSAAFVVDRSASVAPAALAFQATARRLSSSLSTSDQVGVVVFGASATVERPVQPGVPRADAVETQVDASATNLERAIRTARLALPPGGDRRLVLFSDGRETSGSALAEARRAALDGVRIDVVPPPPELAGPARVSRVVAPTTVAQGEVFEVRVIVEGPGGTSGRVELRGAGPPRDEPLSIASDGVAVATFAERATVAGVLTLEARFVTSTELDMGVLGVPLAEQTPAGTAVTVIGPMRLLWVSAQVSNGGPTLLPGAVVERVEAATLRPGTLGAYNAIVLDDVDPAALEPAQRLALVSYTDAGGGLLILGSDVSLPVASTGDATLDTLLPVDTRPRSGSRGSPLALVVAFDKSGSMEELVAGTPKIAFAREAVRSVEAALPPGDSLGVIAFDAAPTTVAPLSPARDAARLDQALRTLRPEGGTAIAPALVRAREWLDAAPRAARKHVLLITDGQTSNADVAAVRQLIDTSRLAVSVVAVSAGAERTALERLATSSGGRAYFADDVRLLPTLVSREASRVAGGRRVTGTFVARVADHALTRGLVGAPRLGGYVVTAAKPSAEVLLRSHLDDPLLAIGRYGLGRVAVYTAGLETRSDGRRSDDFWRWNGAGALMTRTTTWLARHTESPSAFLSLRGRPSSIEVVVEPIGADIVTVDATVSATVNATVSATVDGILRTPGGTKTPLTFEVQEGGRYVATAPASEAGTYLATLSLAAGDGSSPVTFLRGLYWSPVQEMDGTGADTETLTALAAATGGEVLPTGAVSLPGRRPGSRDGRLLFLGLALAVFWAGHAGPAMRWLAHAARGTPQEPMGRAA